MIRAKFIISKVVDSAYETVKEVHHCIGEIEMQPLTDELISDWAVKFSVGGALDNKMAKVCEVKLTDFDPRQYDEWSTYALMVTAIGGVLQTRREAQPKIIMPSGHS